MICYKCQTVIELEDKVYRQQTCPKCDSYMHVCYNCRFFDELAHNQCRESEVRFVKEKDKANFCTYFEPTDNTKGRENTRADDARKKLEDMFKNVPKEE